MKVIADQVSGVQLRGVAQVEAQSVNIVSAPVDSGGVATPLLTGDVSVLDVSELRRASNFNVVVTESAVFPGQTIVNHTPEVASVLASGEVSHVADGTVVLDVISRASTQRVTRAIANPIVTAAHYEFVEFREGSLAKHCTDAVNALIAGKTANSTTKAAWSSNNYNGAAPAGVRNPSCFADPLDFSAISMVANGSYGQNVSLISPRHFIYARHMGPSTAGMAIAWKDKATGSYYTATILATDVVPVPEYAGSDIGIGYLSNPIPITPFKVMPANWRDYVPSAILYDSHGMKTRLAGVTKSHFLTYNGTGLDSFSVMDCYTAAPLFTFAGMECVVTDRSEDFGRYDWASYTGGGSSGSQFFLLVHGDPVLTMSYLFPGLGASYAHYATEIESTMNSMAVAQGDNTPYALAKADLSAFTKYI
ncbi:MAG: hypothetical protein ABL877_10865 [Thiobacillus sp.]